MTDCEIALEKFIAEHQYQSFGGIGSVFKAGWDARNKEIDMHKAHIRNLESGAIHMKDDIARLREAVRGALGWFALFNDEDDQSKWPVYIRKCELALKSLKGEE